MRYLELFIDLDANEEQLDCPFIYRFRQGRYRILQCG